MLNSLSTPCFSLRLETIDNGRLNAENIIRHNLFSISHWYFSNLLFKSIVFLLYSEPFHNSKISKPKVSFKTELIKSFSLVSIRHSSGLILFQRVNWHLTRTVTWIEMDKGIRLNEVLRVCSLCCYWQHITLYFWVSIFSIYILYLSYYSLWLNLKGSLINVNSK